MCRHSIVFVAKSAETTRVGVCQNHLTPHHQETTKTFDQSGSTNHIYNTLKRGRQRRKTTKIHILNSLIRCSPSDCAIANGNLDLSRGIGYRPMVPGCDGY